MDETLFIIWLGAVGAAVGSFLNVVIYRVPRNESLVSPPSHCPKCNHKIRFFDNLPIFGWFLLGGKCRDCKMSINFRYPLIETIAFIIVTTFSCLLMPLGIGIDQIFLHILWLSVLHLFLLTLGMIDLDRQTLKTLYLISFLGPFLILGSFFSFQLPHGTFRSPFDPLMGAGLALIAGFAFTKIIRANNRKLWLFASLAVGGFLGWQMAMVVLLASLPCHTAIVFVTRRSCAVLSLATMSFLVNVWVLVHK